MVPLRGWVSDTFGGKAVASLVSRDSSSRRAGRLVLAAAAGALAWIPLVLAIFLSHRMTVARPCVILLDPAALGAMLGPFN